MAEEASNPDGFNNDGAGAVAPDLPVAFPCARGSTSPMWKMSHNESTFTRAQINGGTARFGQLYSCRRLPAAWVNTCLKTCARINDDWRSGPGGRPYCSEIFIVSANR